MHRVLREEYVIDAINGRRYRRLEVLSAGNANGQFIGLM
jgi:hypothetical protein